MLTMSRCSEDEVSTTTGIAWSFGSPRIWRSTSMPSTFRQLEIEENEARELVRPRSAVLAAAKEEVQGLRPVLDGDDVVGEPPS